jgi:hypothetical protein
MMAGRVMALGVCIAMVASALPFVPGTRGADTPNQWFEALPGAPAGVTFYDVAWSADGTIAMFVGTDGANGKGYFYEPDGNVWTEALMPGGGPFYSNPLLTVSYCPDSWDAPKFMAAGSCGSGGYAFWCYGPGIDCTYSSAGPLQNFWVRDSTYTPNVGAMGSLLFCADNGAQMKLLQVDLSSGGFFTWMIEPHASATLFGVECDPATNDVYMVGGDGSATIYHKFQWNTSANYSIGFPYARTLSDIAFDSHHVPNRMLVTAQDKGGGDVTNVYDIRFAGGSYSAASPVGVTTETAGFNGLAIDPDGRAVIVGWEEPMLTYGVVYDLWTDTGGTDRLARRSDTSGPFEGEVLTSVSIRPSKQPYALVTGSAFKYSYVEAASNIQVDTLYPHISYIELYDAGSNASRLNGQVDVDPGTGSVEYDLVARVWHNTGNASVRQVEAYLWRDNGTSEAQPGAFDTPGFGNLRMHFVWWRDNNTFFQYYPTGPQRETTLDIPGCNWTLDVDGRNVTVRFRFSPHQQVRWANSSGDGWAEPAGTRYDGAVPGWSPEDQSDVAALDDFGSWNIHVEARDVGGAIADAWDEFGLFKYTYIGSSGLPGGGNVYGSGPPNTARWLNPVGNVTFCANVDYQLAINCTDLIGQNLGQTIFVTDVSVRGGDLVAQTNFTAPGVPVFLFGSALPSYHVPLNDSRVTTTSSADGDPGTPESVFYRCWIPSVPEDYYKGTLTYSVTHG